MKFEHFPLSFKHAGKTIKATCTKWKPVKETMYRVFFKQPVSGKETVIVFMEQAGNPERFKCYRLGDERDEFAKSALKALQKIA